LIPVAGTSEHREHYFSIGASQLISSTLFLQSICSPLSFFAMVALRIRPSIVLFGDSLTQLGWGVDGNAGWAALLASAYTRRADVLNRGFSGYNTRHALEVLPRIFGDGPEMKEPLLFCTVYLGANDSALPGERQYVPIDEYQRNLGKIVTSIRERVGEKPPIILMTPPPVDEKRWASYWGDDKPDRLNQISSDYGAVCKQVAADHDCSVIDVFEILGGNVGDYSHHLSDGLHLSGSGNTMLYEGLMAVIEERYPELGPDDPEKEEKPGIPMEEASWRDIC
jgi:lysophospholipase L1-like esterase